MVELYGIEIKNLPSEMSVEEFQRAHGVVKSREQFKLEMFAELFVHLGADRAAINDLTVQEFGDIVRAFNGSQDTPTAEKATVVDIDGFEYKLINYNALSVAKEVEKALASNNYLSMLAATIFRRDDEKAKHQKIEQRAKIFAEKMKADIILPYFIEICHTYASALKVKTDVATEELEEPQPPTLSRV